MLLSNEELERLKRPAGILIPDKDLNLNSLAKYLNNFLISVGDATTERLISMGIIPQIQIVDGRERRGKRALPKGSYKEIRCKNPAGSISREAILAFIEALKSEKPVRIIVEGEEDLLGLVVLAFAPDNSVMLYGQPLEGMVIMNIDDEARGRFKEVIKRIREEIDGE